MYQVLYVDDEHDLLEIAKLYLEISHEFTIDTDTSAQETLKNRDLSEYDAIISDYQMPEMDGITFLKEVRARYGAIPFILFTGRGREEVVIEAINNGADFYLQKGGDPKSLFAELMHKVRTVVQRRQTEDALRNNEERLRMAQTIGQTGNWEYDLKTGKIWASEEGFRIFGIHRQSGTIPIEEIEACIPEQERVQRALLDLIRDKKRYDLEYTINPADGAPRRTIHSVAKLIHTADAIPVKVAGAIQDITEQKEAERVLQESENLYRTIFENTGAATIITRDDGLIEYANKGFEDLSGYPKEEIEGRKSWTEFIIREDQDQRRVDPLTTTLYQFQFIDRNGCIKDCINNLRMIGGTRKSVASIIDLTELKRTEEELRENRRTLVTLMNNLQGMAYRCANDPDWTMEFISGGSAALTGYDPADLINNRTISYGRLIVPEDQQRVWKQIQTGIGRDRPFQFEYRIKDRSGRIKWVWEQGRGIFNDQGDLIALEGYIMDITRRREAEDELNRINERNKALLLANPDLMFVYSADGRIVDFHAGDASALYVPPDRFLGRSIYEVLPPDVAQATCECIARVAETGLPQRYEYSLVIRGGTRYFESRLVPSGDREFLSIVRDITEQKRAADAVQVSEEKYRAVIENMQDLCYRTDLEGTIQMISEAGARLAGYSSPDELIGGNVLDIYVHPEEREVLLALLADQGEVTNYPTTLKAQDGSHRYVTTSSHLYHAADGTVCGVEGVIHDITEEKLARAALIRTREALSKKTEALAILNAIISTANRATDRRQVLAEVLDRTLQLLDFDAGGIYLADCATGTARVVYSKNLPPEFLARVREVPLDRIPYRTLFIEGAPLITDQYEEVSPDHSIPYGFQSVVSVPIISKTRIIGALNVVSTQRQEVSPEERETLISIGRELGGTIERMTADEERIMDEKRLT